MVLRHSAKMCHVIPWAPYLATCTNYLQQRQAGMLGQVGHQEISLHTKIM